MKYLSVESVDEISESISKESDFVNLRFLKEQSKKIALIHINIYLGKAFWNFVIFVFYLNLNQTSKVILAMHSPFFWAILEFGEFSLKAKILINI